MYILDEKATFTKRHKSSHGNSQLFGTLHVIEPQLDTSVIAAYCAGHRALSNERMGWLGASIDNGMTL